MIDHVYICGLKWAIKWVENAEHHGRCFVDERLIVVENNEHEGIRAETLWHEIKHAIWAAMDLREKEKEENVVTRMAFGEITVLSDPRNRMLVSLLTG